MKKTQVILNATTVPNEVLVAFYDDSDGITNVLLRNETETDPDVLAQKAYMQHYEVAITANLLAVQPAVTNGVDKISEIEVKAIELAQAELNTIPLETPPVTKQD